MTIAWEKIIVWIIAILVIAIIVFFMIKQMSVGTEGSLFNSIFGTADKVTTITPTAPATTP